MSKQHFDIIAIGGGSGGLAVAEKAALFGRKVAVIEGYRMGGTCVNNGCVPKKVMWYAANLAHAVDDANAFGIPAKRGKTEWSRLVQAREQYISNINNYWDGYVDESGITRIQGYARFVDQSTVEVDGIQYSADHIVVATGGQPIVPPVPGAEAEQAAAQAACDGTAEHVAFVLVLVQTGQRTEASASQGTDQWPRVLRILLRPVEDGLEAAFALGILVLRRGSPSYDLCTGEELGRLFNTIEGRDFH
jgi:thioredoxin reductase